MFSCFISESSENLKGTIVHKINVENSNEKLIEFNTAARNYDIETLKSILSQEGDYANISPTAALHIALKDGFLGKLKSEKLKKCVEFLIDWNADVNSIEDKKKGFSPLHRAVDNGFEEVAKLLKNEGAQIISSSGDHGFTLATLIAKKLPILLLEEFDNAVTHDDDLSIQSKINLDFSPILQFPVVSKNAVEGHQIDVGAEEDELMTAQTNDYTLLNDNHQKETAFVYSLLDAGDESRSKLLTHPLVTAFLYQKNERVRYHFGSFYISMFLFPILYMLFNYYLYFHACTLKSKTASDETNLREGTNKTITKWYHIAKNEEVCHITVELTVSACFLFLIVIAWTVIEIYLIYRLGIKTRLRKWRTWVTALSLMSMALTLWPGLKYGSLYNITWQYPIAAVGMFLGWALFLLQIGSNPSFAVYLDVLIAILISVLKIYLLFTPLLIGFYQGFSLLFVEDSGIFRFIIMMMDIGSAQYEELIGKSREDYFWYTAMGYVFIVTFIILIVIVFMNFVLGTAVNDIQKFKRRAKISSISRDIQNLFIMDLLFARVRLFPKRETKWLGIKFTPKIANEAKDPEHVNTCSIPIDIQNELIQNIISQNLKNGRVGKVSKTCKLDKSPC